MEEKWRSVGKAIDTIKHTAMPGKQCPAILDSQVPLDGGNIQITNKSAKTDDQTCHNRMGLSQWCQNRCQ